MLFEREGERGDGQLHHIGFEVARNELDSERERIEALAATQGLGARPVEVVHLATIDALGDDRTDRLASEHARKRTRPG